MSKPDDLLGLITSTYLAPDDEEPNFDGKGYTGLITPANNFPADEDEDDTAFQALLSTGLSQEESQEAVDFMKPYSETEQDILDETPLLDGLTRVDDAERQQWLEQKSKEGHAAIDRALEDAVYGEDNMASDEELMERLDSDSDSGRSWGFKKAFRKIGRGIKKTGRLATSPIRKVGSLASRLVPGQKARKARLLRNTYKKLWYEHANWLGQQDKAAGIPLKSRADYEAVSKLWARDQMKRNKLPVSFDMKGSDVLGAQILGADLVGSWYWPFGNLLNFSRTTINNTSDKRADAPVDEHGDAEKPEYQPVGDPSADDGNSQPSAPDQPTADDQQGESHMHGWNGIRDLKGPGVHGNSDSLGAFATQILGGAKTARDNPHAERIVRLITMKLKAGKPISPGELGLLSSAAKEGNLSAQKVLVVLESRGVAMSGDESGLDPWMYKLNPAYWIASKRKKDLIDVEKKNWKENYELQKQLAKQKEVLDEAERAAQATRAVAAAKQQSADTEAKLKEIEASLKGSVSGSFVGHENVTPISTVVLHALEKAGKKETASKLYAKIKSGDSLDDDELQEARQIANLVGRMRVVHGDLVNKSNETTAMHGAFIGACVLGGIETAQKKNTKQSQFADAMGQKIASGQPLTTAERNELARVLGDQEKLHRFAASLVSGAAFAGCPQKKTWTRGAFIGAMKAMSEEDKKMLAAIVKLAKLGNPRAKKALAELKKSGEIMGGDVMGFGIKKFFHYATAPIWLPAKGLYKGEQALFGKKGGSNPEQARLARMRAAQSRLKAAQAKAAAADAESEAEQRAQQAIADAADAEADAADAEAFSKEQKMKTAEAEANPDSIPAVAGDFVGGWTDMIGKDTKASKIVQKASENSATGTKIRSGATLYKKAKAGDPKATRAIKVMVAKAKKGDPQAIRDVNAVKAGRIAVRAKAKAQKKQLVAQKRAARKATVANAQRKIENRVGDRLARMSHKSELKKLAKAERLAFEGNPKAKAFVAKRVEAAKRGDKKAQAQVRGMQLGRDVRTQVTTKQEARRVRAATKMADRIRKGDPKAIRQYAILKDAANRGNPNAQRAMRRLAIGGAVAATIATGAVVLPKLVHKQKEVKPLKPGTLGYRKAQRQIALVRQKIKNGTATPAEIGNGANLALQMGDTATATFLASLNDKTLQEARQKVAVVKSKAEAGTATREEITSGAKIANQIGEKETAGTLAQAASSAPSSTEKLKQVGNTVAAAQVGNPEAQAKLDKALEGAKSGNVEDINTLGHVMAAKTVDAANKGQPISPTMADAINTQARAQAGDPVAQDTLKRVSEAATQPNPAPEATLAAGAAVGAAVLASTLANKPKAKQELMDRVNPPIPAAEKGTAQAKVAEIVAKVNEGTATPEEGARGVELAHRLGNTRLAAEIAAKAPPCDYCGPSAMSSLPDAPLPPIQGARELIKESLKAVTLTTRDPVANWREGIASRSRNATLASPAAVTTSSGWSPFNLFRKAKSLAPYASLTSPIAAVASLASLAKKKEAPAPKSAPAPAASPAPASAPAPEAEKPSETATAGEFIGSDSYKDLMAKALQTKKISKADFNRAVEESAGPGASQFAKTALAEQTLKFLQSKNVVVGGTFVGHSYGQKPAGMSYKQWQQDLKDPEYRRSHHWGTVHGDFVGASGEAFIGHSHRMEPAGVSYKQWLQDLKDPEYRRSHHWGTVHGDFVGASNDELEKLMSKSLSDDQLDRLMTRVVQDDAMLRAIRILQKRPDLGERVAQRASAGHPAAGKIYGIAKLATKAQSGDPAAKKAFVDWCSTQSHSSSSGSMASQMNHIAAQRDGDFVGASNDELEKLMSKSLSDDQLDRLMTRVVQDDAMLRAIRILQKRPDLGERVAQRASAGHPAAGKIYGIAKLATKAQSGDPAAKKAFVDWCSTQSHSSSSGSMASFMNHIAAPRDAAYFAKHHRHMYGYRVKGDFVGAFAKTFIGKSDEFKQLIIAALKAKKMSRDDFNKAIAAHVKPDANQAEKTAAGEQMLKFLAIKKVKVG